ncbi:hypothetical protein [Burkholderia pseudomallei]|uniref:hypothetical protein n=1 Tax=Burkholderia pseudomallei TaxID=28450 RepID=UPI000A19FED4|nr:hypothetical protein [Burkholderia pseudomallei]ARK86065.1 hypothetical protein BOC42_00425 [Burkholderia pseudomallei]
MTNTAELIVRISNVTHAVAEASAKGFANNPKATAMVTELKELAEKLEELALAECVGRNRK